MAEPLRFKTQDGREFILEFNRRTVAAAEADGVIIEEIDKQMMNIVPKFFYYAFKMHHPWIKQEETDKILFDEFKGLTADELTRLAELFAAPYKALVNTNDDGDEKNARLVTIL